MRLAIRLLVLLALPSAVFGWLARVPPLTLDQPNFDTWFGYDRRCAS